MNHCECGKPDCILCLIQSLAPQEERYMQNLAPIEALTITFRPQPKTTELEREVNQATLDTIRSLMHDIAQLATIAGVDVTVNVRRER